MSSPPQHIDVVSPEMFLQIIEALNTSKGGLTREQLTKYTGKSSEYVRRAVKLGFMLGVAEITTDGRCMLASTAHKKLDLATILAGYEPFAFFCFRINQDDKATEAARKTAALFQINNPLEEIESFFVTWGLGSGLLNQVDKKIGLTFRLSDPLVDQSRTAVEHELSARIFILEKLGGAKTELSGHEINLLSHSLLIFQSEPRNSIDDAGRAVEDFLRSFAKKVGANSTSANGITEITNAIVSSTPKSLHPKQAEVLRGLGAMRNMAAHSKDKKTDIPWEISPEAAFAYVILATKIIVSLNSFTQGHQRI